MNFYTTIRTIYLINSLEDTLLAELELFQVAVNFGTKEEMKEYADSLHQLIETAPLHLLNQIYNTCISFPDRQNNPMICTLIISSSTQLLMHAFKNMAAQESYSHLIAPIISIATINSSFLNLVKAEFKKLSIIYPVAYENFSNLLQEKYTSSSFNQISHTDALTQNVPDLFSGIRFMECFKESIYNDPSDWLITETIPGLNEIIQQTKKNSAAVNKNAAKTELLPPPPFVWTSKECVPLEKPVTRSLATTDLQRIADMFTSAYEVTNEGDYVTARKIYAVIKDVILDLRDTLSFDDTYFFIGLIQNYQEQYMDSNNFRGLNMLIETADYLTKDNKIIPN